MALWLLPATSASLSRRACSGHSATESSPGTVCHALSKIFFLVCVQYTVGIAIAMLFKKSFESFVESLMDEGCLHRKRIYTEEKAKVVSAVWGTKCIPFLAELAIAYICTRTI